MDAATIGALAVALTALSALLAELRNWLKPWRTDERKAPPKLDDPEVRK
jgi:hypothetical protein